MAAPDQDPVEEVVRRLEHSRRILTVVAVAAIGGVVAMWAHLFNEPGEGLHWFILVMLGTTVLIYVVVFIVASRRAKEMPDFVSRVRARIREIGLRRSAPIVVFDNGLVLSWLLASPVSHMIGLWQFFHPTGAVFKPSLSEARKLAARVPTPWTTTLVRHSAGRPFHGRGPWTDPWKSQLDRLRERLGVLHLRLDWLERSGRRIGRPEVIGCVMATANKLGKMIDGQAFLLELDRIQELLGEARRFVQARGLHRRRRAF